MRRNPRMFRSARTARVHHRRAAGGWRSSLPLALFATVLCGVWLVAVGTAGAGPNAHRLVGGRSLASAARGPAPAAGKAKKSRRIPFHTLNPRALARAKAAAASHRPSSSANRPAASAKTTPGRLASVFNGINAPGLAAADGGGSVPPDTTGAIGPNHYVEPINSTIAVYDRSLNELNRSDMAAFEGFPGLNAFDPQVNYDSATDRWYFVSDLIDAIGADYLAVGYSLSNDPTDLSSANWCMGFINTDAVFGGGAGSHFADYPKLGHNDNQILIGTNMFGTSSFETANIWALAKPPTDGSCAPPQGSVYGAPGSPLPTASGGPAFTPVPANNADSTTNGYVVAADFAGSGSASQISAYLVDPTPGDPLSINGMTVNTYSTPANVPQPGTNYVIDSSDTRLTQAVAAYDPNAGAEAVWTQHTIDSGAGDGTSVVEWYELLPDTATVAQEGTISGGPTQSAFNGAISPAADGTDAFINYNIGGPNDLVDVRAQSRDGTLPAGAMQNETTLVSSDDINQDFSCPGSRGSCRWGDYAGATPDPANPGVVWGTNEANGPSHGPGGAASWKTQNFALTNP